MAEFNISQWKLLLRDITEHYGFATQERRVPEAEWGTGKLLCGRSVMSNSLQPHGLLLLSMAFSGKNAGVGCQLLEFHGLYIPWGHKESDRTDPLSLSSSRGSSPPRDRTPVSCIGI